MDSGNNDNNNNNDNQDNQDNQDNNTTQDNNNNQDSNDQNQQDGNNSDTTNQDQQSSSGSASFIDIPVTAQAGGITITQPAQTATSYYKLAEGQMITFGWNFTGLYVTPDSLTISAACDNGNTFPIGEVPGTATEVVWDIWSYQQNNPQTPLVPTSYTLLVWDERGPSATPSAGYMQPNSQLKFAMYTPADYTPLSDGWTCSGCNSAPSSFFTSPIFVSVVVTTLVMFLSGFGLLRATRRSSHAA